MSRASENAHTRLESLLSPCIVRSTWSLPRGSRPSRCSLTALSAAPCLAAETPTPTPAWLPPHRDDTSHPTVLEAGRRLRDKLWRPAPPTPETRRELGLPMQRITNEDQGNITIARGDQGELDVNWEDPEELQNALLSIIESFYQNHPNRNPHFITVVTTFQVQSLAAFYMPLANDVRGIGYQHSGRGGEIFNYVGAGLALDGIIFMNNFRGYLGAYAPLGRLTFNQELGHRWGAHVAFQSRAGESMDLLGRDCSHWSFFMDTNNSAMEGNRWVDNGNGTFETTTSFYDFGYSQLDRYLMGFAPAEASRPWFFVSAAGGWNCAQTYRNGELNPSALPADFRVGGPGSGAGERPPGGRERGRRGRGRGRSGAGVRRGPHPLEHVLHPGGPPQRHGQRARAPAGRGSAPRPGSASGSRTPPSRATRCPIW